MIPAQPGMYIKYRMKISLCTLINITISRALCVSLIFLLPGDGKTEIHTLDDLLQEAIANSREMQKIKKEIELTLLSNQKIYAAAIPQIKSSLELNHYLQQYIPYSFTRNASSSSDKTNEGFSGSPKIKTTMQQEMLDFEDIFSLPENTFSATIGIRFPLFSQGRTFLNLKINRIKQAMQICSYEEEKTRKKAVVTKLYYRVLLEQKQTELQKQKNALSEDLHRLIVVQFNSGLIRELDTLNSYLRLQQDIDLFEETENDRLLAGEEIIRECGLAESPGSFWVDGAFPEPVFYITLDESIVLLHEENRQIRQFKGEEDIKNVEITLEKMAYLPSLFAGGSFGRIGQFNRYNNLGAIRWGDDQRVFAGLSWTLFNGLARKHDINIKKVERDILRIDQQEIIEELELRTRSLFDKIMILKRRIETAKRIISIAEKSYTMAKKSYEVGDATLVDVQKTETELNKTSLQYSRLLYDFHCMVTDFKEMIGKL